MAFIAAAAPAQDSGKEIKSSLDSAKARVPFERLVQTYLTSESICMSKMQNHNLALDIYKITPAKLLADISEKSPKTTAGLVIKSMVVCKQDAQNESVQILDTIVRLNGLEPDAPLLIVDVADVNNPMRGNLYRPIECVVKYCLFVRHEFLPLFLQIQVDG